MLGVVVCLFLAARLVDFLSANQGLFLLCVTVVAVSAIFFGVILPRRQRVAMYQRVDAITDGHIDALIRQRAILIRNDPYGKPILDKWHSDVNYFITHHIRPALIPDQQKPAIKEHAAIFVRILQRVEGAAMQRPALLTLPSNLTPAGFEAYCAETLRACGWQVSLTPLCRDQGVDVIAAKNGARVVLQCKLYSSPVGNKAVQEIAAGRVHQQAHYGVVVTNNTYTPSAIELAATNRIGLLRHTDLPNLDQWLHLTVGQ